MDVKQKFKVGDLFFYRYSCTSDWMIGRVRYIKDAPVYTVSYDIINSNSRPNEFGFSLNFFQVGSKMYDKTKLIDSISDPTILAMVL